MKICMYILVLASMAINFTGCSKSKQIKATKKSFFVNGDPMELIKGSAKNKKSFFKRDNYKDFSGYGLLSVTVFNEKEPISKKSAEEIKKEQTPDPQHLDNRQDEEPKPEDILDENKNEGLEEKSELEDVSNDSKHKKHHLENTQDENVNEFKFTNLKRGKTYFSGNIFGDDYKFVFEADKGSETLNLKKMYIGDYLKTINVEHFSITEDKRIFSILLSMRSYEVGTQLVAFYFVKDQDQSDLISALEGMFYTNATNSKIGWPQDEVLNIDICSKSLNIPIEHTNSGEVKYNFDMLNMWKDSLEGRLEVKYSHKTTYPPFSDLNSHCIYTVENLYTEQGMEYSNTGFAMSFHDETKAVVIDSDVFILVKEMEKQNQVEGFEYYRGSTYLDELYQKSLDWTLLHEVGHMLQLDHQFTGVESIMSYDDQEENKLFEYDIKAVQALYSVIEPPLLAP